MAKQTHELLAFNRGVVSPRLMARLDVPRVALSAETQTNFIPSTLGSMSLRPGFEYVGATKGNLAAKHIPFIFSNSDMALIELTPLVARIRIAGTILTRPTVATLIANPTFDADLLSWTDLDEGSATSVYLTGGFMSLLGTGGSAAIREQLVTLGVGASGVEHALRVTVTRGPVKLRVHTAGAVPDFVPEVSLQTGVHSIAFTPGQNFYVLLFSYEEYPVLIDGCHIEANAQVEIPTIWPAAALPFIRYTQSGDVVYVACTGYAPYRIERTAARSWRVVQHLSDKGPFRAENLVTQATIAASALKGLVTLTATRPTFQSTHVGAIFKAVSDGQTVSQNVTAADVWTDTIKVEGADATRIFGITLTGVWIATVTLQRSVGVTGNWKDVISYTTNQSITLDDALRNQTIYYRIGVKTGGFTSGTVIAEMVYASGSITGIARITAVASTTSATAYVLKDFGGLAATDNWSEGAWSAYRGYPACLALRDGRLWLAGNDKIWASVVDDYNNHDAAYIGDAGPISRSIGEGPVAVINWMVSAASQLVLGADGAEYSIASSTQGEPITPLNFNIRPVTSLGSYNVDAEQLDGAILCIDRSGSRLMELTKEGPADLAILAPQMLLPYVVDMAVQRRPDSRIHCVRSDGKVAVLVTSKTEDVRAWILVETDGTIEEAFVLPGLEEDSVYYVVKRTVNSATVRYVEKVALSSECVGGVVNKQADSFAYYNGAATATITGLGHLVAKSVVVWADGVDRGTYTVAAGGTVTLAAPTVSQAITGLAYTAQFKSTKLAPSGVALLARKRVSHIGVLLTDTHAQGLKYGPDFVLLDDLPAVEAGATVDATGIWAAYNYDHIEFNGSYTVDSRLCLQATAPRPCTVLAAIIELDT